MEAEQYYSEKVTDAQNRLDTLNEANGQEEENQSAIIFKAAKITETTGIFSEWCSENLETRADQCLSVFEDYVNSNDHIVTQINELMSSSNN